MVHAGIYDAWAAYDARAAGTRMGGALRRRPAERTLANKNAAISHAAYRALADLFPARRDAFDADRWQPLRLPSGAVQAFATPHWYRVTPFALRSAAQFRPDGPTAHVDAQGRPNQAYLRQVRETLRDSRQLDDRSKSIAAYWWDGPSTELPPGHWCLLAQYVSRRDHHSVDQDAKMFLALTGALLDASIAAWGGPGRGTRPIRGEDWLPYQPAAVVTPPFAEYVSGHSTFSAAAAEVLASFTGSRQFGLSVTIPAAARCWSRASSPPGR